VFSLKPREKKQHPFSSLFKQLTPKEFVFVFRDDRVQTLAFLLSYASGAYSRKVINLIKDKDTRKMLTESLCYMKHTQRTPITGFVIEIEKAALECAKGLRF
jgi:hypothetical protein